MSNEPIDHSDELARIGALISLLDDFDPDGRWKSHSLVKRWRKSRYSLVESELKPMTTFLEAKWGQVKPQPNAKVYEQMNLFGGDIDA